MDATWIKSRIAAHVTALAGEIGPRPAGSPANRLATDYVRMVLAAAGLTVEESPFTCRWWEPGPAALQIGGAWIDVPPAPFSRPCNVRGRVTRLATDAALAEQAIEPGRIIVITDDLTVDSYFSASFPFVELPDQRRRLARLEALRPAAVIAVIDEARAMPVLEDGDLAFPYLSVTTAVGDRMREHREVAVRVGGAIHDGDGVNLSVRLGGAGDRVIVSAHLDSKVTTPGAFDNAGGVAILLALAEWGITADVPVELVFFNGEDHYQAPGEQAWLAATDLDGVREAINLDGAGVVGHAVAVVPLASPPEVEARVQALVASRSGWIIGPEWYESDHALFAARGIPSIAITSAGAHEFMAGVIHTERDTPRMVDPAILADVAGFLQDWLEAGVGDIRGSGGATGPP